MDVLLNHLIWKPTGKLDLTGQLQHSTKGERAQLLCWSMILPDYKNYPLGTVVIRHFRCPLRRLFTDFSEPSIKNQILKKQPQPSLWFYKATLIIYIGQDKKEMRKYARECPDLIRLVFKKYGVPPKCTIYSDEGNSFFENGNSVLRQIGFKRHKCFPSKVHQYISPNDNRLHGTSKKPWRSGGRDFSDDVDSCLALLSYLDRDIIKHSKHWWDRNMIKLTEDGVRTLLGEGPFRLSHLHKSWKRRYEEFIHEYKAHNK